jgi:hypothetical protein
MALPASQAPPVQPSVPTAATGLLQVATARERW